MKDLAWLEAPCAALDNDAYAAAQARQGVLTKPPGALGQLERVAMTLAAMQGVAQPQAQRVHIAVFAGDHGVTEEGISAFPQAVTAEMVRNFARGGAAICVLARQWGATLEVIDLGTVQSPGPLPHVRDERLGAGTNNFTREPAMTETQLALALAAGRASVVRAVDAGAQIFVGGEMGIGNTTAAAALACALLDETPALLAGPGTGLDHGGVRHKAAVIASALALHGEHLHRPAEALRRLGGFEIAALAGAYITCAQIGLPAIIDGFITTVAALAAERLRPGAQDWFIYAHRSAEPGHRRVLEELQAEPLLDLGMRLGEGSGAATAVPLLRAACALHNEMATFADAGVSGKL